MGRPCRLRATANSGGWLNRQLAPNLRRQESRCAGSKEIPQSEHLSMAQRSCWRGWVSPAVSSFFIEVANWLVWPLGEQRHRAGACKEHANCRGSEQHIKLPTKPDELATKRSQARSRLTSQRTFLSHTSPSHLERCLALRAQAPSPSSRGRGVTPSAVLMHCRCMMECLLSSPPLLMLRLYLLQLLQT